MNRHQNIILFCIFVFTTMIVPGVILACCAIVFSVALGVIFFKEKFNLVNYAGVALAVVAVILTHVGHNS